MEEIENQTGSYGTFLNVICNRGVSECYREAWRILPEGIKKDLQKGRFSNFPDKEIREKTMVGRMLGAEVLSCQNYFRVMCL